MNKMNVLRSSMSRWLPFDRLRNREIETCGTRSVAALGKYGVPSISHGPVVALALCASLALLLSCNQDETAFGPQDGQAFESTVAGRVADRSGKPLSGALVTALPGGATTVTGPDGSFTLAKLRSGSYRIAIAKDDYRDTVYLDSVRVGLSVKRDIGAIGMRYRYATIKGVVEDSSGTGQPAAAIAVEDQMSTAMAMNGGKFTLGRVEPGRVRLFTAIQGLGYGSLDTVLSPDDTLKDVKLRILHKGGAVTGQVVGNDGKAVQGAQVQTVGGALKTVTDGSGFFRITEVPGGGKVVVEVVKGELSTVVSGVRVAEGSRTDLAKIAIVEASTSANVSIRAGLAMAMTTDSVAMLVADTISEDSTFRILRYLWSVDNGSTWDTTSTNLFLVFLKRLGWTSGNHPVLVKVVSVDGKISATGSITVRLMLPPDWTAPNVVRSSPKQDTTRLWKDSLLTFAWTVGDDRKLDSVWIDGKPATGSAGVFSRQVALRPGRNSYAVVARDSAGNVARDSVFVTRRDRDTTNPSLARVTPLRDTVYAYGDSSSKTVSWKVTDVGGLDSVWLDGVGVKLDSSGKVSKSLTISAGKSIVVRVRARDQAGNANTDSLTVARRALTSDTLAIPGLVAYWPFNGDAKDASGNGNDGVTTDIGIASDRFGRVGSAFSFNGTTGKISVAKRKQLSFNGPLTISVWVKRSAKGRVESVFNSWFDGTDNDRGVVVEFDAEDSIEFHVAKDYNGPAAPSPRISDDSWHSVVATWDGEVIALHVDGNLISTKPYSETLVDQSTLGIGYDPNIGGKEGTFFSGVLDDIRVFGRSLDDAEIKQLYREGGWTGNVSPSRADTGLVGSYFDMESPVTPPSLVREAGGYSDQAVFPWSDGAYNGFAEVSTSDTAHLNGGRSLRVFLDNYGGSGGNSFQKTGINLHADTGFVWVPASDTIAYWMTDVDYTTSSRWAWGQGMALVTAQGPVMVWNRCATWGGGEHCMGLGGHPGSSYGFDDAADSVVGSDGRKWRLYRVVVPDSLRGGKVKEVLFHAHQASWDGTRARNRFFLDRVTGLLRTARTQAATTLSLANLNVSKGMLSPLFHKDSLAYRDTIVDSAVVVSAYASDTVGSSVWIDGVKRNSASIAPSYLQPKRVRVVVRSNGNGDSLVHLVDVYRRDVDPPKAVRVAPKGDTTYAAGDTAATVSWSVSDAQSGFDSSWIGGKLVWPDASGKVSSSIPLVAGSTKTVYLRVKDRAGLVSVDSLKLTRAAVVSEDTLGIAGLVAYWPFNGDAKDKSGYGNDGTVNGAALTKDRFGMEGNAFSFDGQSSLNCGKPAALKQLGDYSVSGWINADSMQWRGIQGIDYGEIATKSTSGFGTPIGWSLEIKKNVDETSYRLQGWRGHAEQESRATSVATIRPSQWVYVASTYHVSTGTFSLYVNGVECAYQTQTQGKGASTSDSGLEFEIGRQGPSDEENPAEFHGLLDDIRIYNRALNASEIQKLYHERGWTGPAIPPDTVTLAVTVPRSGADTLWPLDTVKASSSGNLEYSIDSGAWTVYPETGIVLAQACSLSVRATDSGKIARTWGKRFAFTTWNPNVTYGNLHDARDGKDYRTVKIGTQTWMAENLNYRNTIGGTDSVGICSSMERDSCSKYGRLYTWQEAMGFDNSYGRILWGGRSLRTGVCPTGWHVPRNYEWDSLLQHIGASEAGRRLKSMEAWKSVGAGTDDLGLRILPGGTSCGDFFCGAGSSAVFRSATEADYSSDSVIALSSSSSDVQRTTYSKDYNRLSLRCIEDSPDSSTNLSALVVDQGSIVGGFDSLMTDYTDSVASTVMVLSITAIASSPSATLTIGGTSAASGVAMNVDVSVDTTIAIVVGNLNSASTRTYRLAVKHRSNDAVRNNLTASLLGLDGSWNQSVATYDTFTDPRDSHLYRTVKIGTQTWMAENLGFKSDSSWWFANSPDSGAKYGRLYTWAAAMGLPDSCNSTSCQAAVAARGVKGACPVGWHMPSDSDWNVLSEFLGDTASAGTRLKSVGGWLGGGGGTDAYGFRGLPGGRRTEGSMYNSGYNAIWWSSTEAGGSNAWRRRLNDNFSTFSNWDGDFKQSGFSVRCLRD